jgi:hypothetical protein
MARFGALASATLVLLALAAGGCAGPSASEESAEKQKEEQEEQKEKQKEQQEKAKEKRKQEAKIGPADLERMNRDLADRSVAIFSDALEEVARDNPSLDQRALAKYARLTMATSAYEIVTSGDPFTQIVDLTIGAELGATVWDEEGRAVRIFGEERGGHLVRATREVREEVHTAGKRAMNDAQLDAIAKSVREWRTQHPEVQVVSFVRFREFSLTPQGKELLAGVEGGLGAPLGSITGLSTVGEAGRSVESARQLGDRVFYLMQRLPILVHWEVDSIVTGTLAKPEVDRAVSGFVEASAAIARVSATLERITGPAGTGGLADNLRDARIALAEGKDMAAAVGEVVRASEALSADTRETLRAAEVFAKRRDEPIRVAEITAAADRLAAAARETDALARETDAILTSPELERRLADVKGIAAELRLAQGGAAALVDRAFWRAAMLVVITLVTLFALLLLYRWLASRLLARGAEEAARAAVRVGPAGRPRWSGARHYVRAEHRPRRSRARPAP